MPLEKQVCNLENAKRLKELGVKQESLFWYQSTNKEIRLKWEAKDKDSFSAFTVAELGKMLPDNYHSFRKGGDKKYRCELDRQLWKFQKDIPVEEADTEADTRAKMLIYLLENNLLTLPSKHIN